MDLIQIIVLGLVQGITEWIPISSKTQDTLVFLKVFGGEPALVVPMLLYLHIGTLLAASVYFRRELLEILKTKVAYLKAVSSRPADAIALTKSYVAQGRTGFLLSSLFFTGVVGVPLLLLEKNFFPNLDASALFLLMGLGLVATGALLLAQDGKRLRQAGTVGWRDGVMTGVLQGFSVLPGVSRSGTTSTGLIWRGFDTDTAFSLSFLLSIPTVLLAEIVLWAGSIYFGGCGTGGFACLGGLSLADGLLLSLSSFVFGYLALESILRAVKKVNLAYAALAWGAIIVLAAAFGVA
ncbi:undecaprenyl-diphosphate phosphatase [Candidatus Parvarchaeota archaeon]|nr:undecaprenyl-diphosphate phosphatase [Candidatus Parvarchaeota archaeon]